MHDAQALKPAEGQPAERAGLPGVETGVGREGDRMGVGNREPASTSRFAWETGLAQWASRAVCANALAERGARPGPGLEHSGQFGQPTATASD